MINHARTLLLNASGGGSGFDQRPGEEFVPPGFRPVTLSSPLRSIHRILFGDNTDAAFRNYRARELMGLLHATELEEFVTSLDSRITYDVLAADQFFDSLFQVNITPLGGTTDELFLQGQLSDKDRISRVEEQWRVRVASGVSVEVTRITAPGSVASITYTLTDGLSDSIPLPGSSLSVRFPAGIGNEWYVTAATRPKADLSDLLLSVDAVSEEAKLGLFGVGSPLAASEPFLTFRNLYQKHPEMPYRLGGVLLALIYQIDRLRQSPGT